MARPKLILYTDSNMVGGAEHYLAMIAPLLASQWELVLFHRPDADLTEVLALLPKNLCKTVPAARAGLRLEHLTFLKEAFAKERPDLIFFNLSHYYTSKIALLAAIIGHWPFVVFEHGVPADGVKFGSTLNRLFVRWSLNNSRAVIAPSRAVARFFAGHLQVSDVAVVSHGIDRSVYQADRFDREKIRQEIGLPATAQILLYIGHFDERKRPDRVIRVFSQLAGEFPLLHLILLGSGPLEEQLRAQAGLTKGPARIHFLPRRPRTASVLAASDVLIHLSSSESFGLVVAEAMALGVVPVASNIDALPEVVGEAGYLVDPDDDTESITAVRELLTNHRHYLALQKKGRERIHERFDREQMGDQLKRILKEALSKKVMKLVVL